MKAVILLLTGFIPLALAVFMIHIGRDDTYATLAYSISLLLGGVLSAWIADKFFHIPFKDHCVKLTFPIMLAVVLTAIFWSLSTCFLFTSDMGRFPRYYGKMYTLSTLQLIGISWLTPIAEELIFRFSILNLLRGKSREPLRNACAVLVTAIAFTVPHLIAGTSAMLDLFLFGCIAGFILVRTNNIVYPICFHIVANLTAMVAYNKLSQVTVKDWLWITLPLAVCFLGGMMIATAKQEANQAKSDEDDDEDDEDDEEPDTRRDIRNVHRTAAIPSEKKKSTESITAYTKSTDDDDDFDDFEEFEEECCPVCEDTFDETPNS